MTNYVCRYPDGAAGIGLLLLRVCYASVAFAVVAVLPPVPAGVHTLHAIAAVISLCLAIGFATRLAAVLLGLAALASVPGSGSVQQLLLAGHVGGCAGLALIGAGAFSIDARRHGRRVIHLQANTPDRVTDD
jgi:hypothetical protein